MREDAMSNGESGSVSIQDRASPIVLANQRWAPLTEPVTGEPVMTISAATASNVAEHAHFIDDKEAQLGPAFTGAPTEDIGWYDAPQFGLVRRYENCAIYWSEATGAWEIHGAIRDKYDAINGVNLLGLPTTDQRETPDKIGRFNHFANNGSIYWHRDTGPMAVHGRIRDLWAARGWEGSALGYPTSDVFAVSGVPACLFQNGALSADAAFVDNEGFADDSQARATVTPDQLMDILWRQVDTLMHESPDNVGLHPSRGLDHVSDNAPGFWNSRNRVISVHVDGFVDNGAVAPDTDFTLYMDLLFYTADPPMSEQKKVMLRNGEEVPAAPGQGIYVTRMGSRVTADGLGSGKVARGVSNGIVEAFAQPMHVGEYIPPEAMLIGLVVMPDGSLTVCFVNNPTGRGAANSVRQAISNM
jgi:hypothetical protein